MKRNLLFATLISLLFVACTNPCPVCNEDPCTCPEPDPEGTVYYTETQDLFPNPERGFLQQLYYESNNLKSQLSADAIQRNRENDNMTLYLQSYYLTDYIESDISQEFLDRMERNFQALREGGAKVVLRYSYKHSDNKKDQPWDATLEWMKRHIDQLQPYWEEYTDVILCLQAGFIGVWGEWYYTTTFKFNPYKDEDFVPRWELINHLLDALPEDRQLAFRTPGYKMRYLRMHGLDETPLTEAEAYQPTAKARLCGHNDCFLASSNDVGTYFSPEERTFWEEDTKYTLMGGETCGECASSNGPNAIKQMARYHWTYINNGYHQGVIKSWETDGSMKEIKRRLGYRFVLDKAYPTQQPKAGEPYSIVLTLRNVGFSSLVNARNVELILVDKDDPANKIVYPQQMDPRFWTPGDTTITTLHAKLQADMTGEYKVYLNLPDPYPTIHDNPMFSVRFANEDIWDEKTGYNYLTDLVLQ